MALTVSGGSMKERYAFVIMIRDKRWQEFRRLYREGKQVLSYVGRGAAPPKNASLLIFYVIKPACMHGNHF